MKSFSKRAALAVVILGTAAFAAMPATSPATAAGKSGTVAGCYAQWWNTAFAGYCVNTPHKVTVRLHADCKAQVDYTGPWRTINGSSTPFDNQECTFEVRSAWLAFK